MVLILNILRTANLVTELLKHISFCIYINIGSITSTFEE